MANQDQYRKDGPDKHPPQDRGEHYDKQNPDSDQDFNRPMDGDDNGNNGGFQDDVDDDFDDD